MSDQTASFKVTLYSGENDGKEVRRFVLPKSTLTSFSILRDKLQVVFQCIKNQPFEVSWNDNEGDRVLISSDEELMIAMKEMGGDVYRLQIHTNQPRLADSNTFACGGPLHPNVCCDVCAEEIKGYRYKCIQCPDYDLCSLCESSQNHKEHFMLRIPYPITWKPEFGHRLAHLMSKSARKHRGAGHCGEGRGKGFAHHNHSCHYHEFGHGGQKYQIPQFVQQIFRNMWDPTAAQPEQQPEAGATSSGTDNNAGGEGDRHAAYLKKIGETVASLLDPLGIDVNIEVETKGDKDAKSRGKEESDDEKMNESDEKPKENLNETAAPCSTKPETQAGGSKEESPKLEERSSKREKSESDSDEWTVINRDALPTDVKVQAEKESSSGSGSKPADENHGCSSKMTDSGEKVPIPVVYPPKYPTLNANPEEPVNPDPISRRYRIPIIDPSNGHNIPGNHPLSIPPPVLPPVPLAGQMTGNIYPHHAPTPTFRQMNHPLPHINQALILMTSMGFNNEGGWLTSLLEAVNGDVSKALDILQPVKK